MNEKQHSLKNPYTGTRRQVLTTLTFCLGFFVGSANGYAYSHGGELFWAGNAVAGFFVVMSVFMLVMATLYRRSLNRWAKGDGETIPGEQARRTTWTEGKMSFDEFLSRVIDDGIAAAKADYVKPEQKHKLEGSIEGFEACRDKSSVQLALLLADARQAAQRAYQESAGSDEVEDYWRVRCYEAEVEWVCNCVSAVLMNESRECIVPPTARGVMKAAEIVGVRQ